MGNRRERKRLRHPTYDYASPGAYFITTVTKGRLHLFGDVIGGKMRLNEFGEIVDLTWHDLPNHVAGILLDAFVVMPNHVHGIIVITDDNTNVGAGSVGAGSEPAPTEPAHVNKRHGLPEIVRQLKTFSARRINQLRQTPGVAVWQRGYHDRIIRDDREWAAIRAYILDNPRRWAEDRNNLGMLGYGG